MVKFSIFQKVAGTTLICALVIIMFIYLKPAHNTNPIVSSTETVSALFVGGEEGEDLISAELKSGVTQEDIDMAAASLEQLDEGSDINSLALLGLIMAIDNAQKQLDERNDSNGHD